MAVEITGLGGPADGDEQPVDLVALAERLDHSLFAVEYRLSSRTAVSWTPKALTAPPIGQGATLPRDFPMVLPPDQRIGGPPR
ncbi:hypothetical protein [Streptomyces sp. NPDC003710]